MLEKVPNSKHMFGITVVRHRYDGKNHIKNRIRQEKNTLVLTASAPKIPNWLILITTLVV